MPNVQVDSKEMLPQDSIYENEETNENNPENVVKNRSHGRKKVDVAIESNVDKVLEHLNKIQKFPLDAVEMLMLSHAKTIKIFSPKRQAIAKNIITEIVTNFELEQKKINTYHKIKLMYFIFGHSKQIFFYIILLFPVKFLINNYIYKYLPTAYTNACFTLTPLSLFILDHLLRLLLFYYLTILITYYILATS